MDVVTGRYGLLYAMAAFLLGQTPASIWYWCADQVRGGLGCEGAGLGWKEAEYALEGVELIVRCCCRTLGTPIYLDSPSCWEGQHLLLVCQSG